MTPEEALGQIYAMRESIAHGWKPNQDQELALALADMLDESKKYKHLYYELIYLVGMKHPGEARHQTAQRYISMAENHSYDAARSNHEPF